MDDFPKSLGDLIPDIVRKARPTKKSLQGKRLAQKILDNQLAEHASIAHVASVKVGIVTIETGSAALYQELEGFRREALFEAFRVAGMTVKEVRFRLVDT